MTSSARLAARFLTDLVVPFKIDRVLLRGVDALTDDSVAALPSGRFLPSLNDRRA